MLVFVAMIVVPLVPLGKVTLAPTSGKPAEEESPELLGNEPVLLFTHNDDPINGLDVRQKILELSLLILLVSLALRDMRLGQKRPELTNWWKMENIKRPKN